MTRARSIVVVACATVVLAAVPARARIAGGGPAETDCQAEWDGVSATSGAVDVECADGDACDADGAADGRCTFGLRICVLQADVEGCTPRALSSVAVKPRGLGLVGPSDLSAPGCGPQSAVVVPLRSKRGRQRPSRRRKLSMKARAPGGPPDVDRLALRCVPGVSPTTCANSSGGPDTLEIEIVGPRTDFDSGWTGISHDLTIVPGVRLTFCLDGCDLATNPRCRAQAPTGASTLNGTVYGPPLPLLAGTIPVCAENGFADSVVPGTLDLQTGALTADLHLVSELHYTSVRQVCPRCVGGTCDGGPNEGSACQVEGTVSVPQGEGDTQYPVSRDCPPGGDSVGAIDIRIPLTTGRSELPAGDGGSPPCDGGGGVRVQHDDCGAGVCQVGACVGDALNGGINQATPGNNQSCCSNDGTRACFPTAAESLGPAEEIGRVVRTGSATPPGGGAGEAPWPDPTYPKTGTATLVATLCEPPTKSFAINKGIGLPGPGALYLPNATTVRKAPSARRQKL